MNTDYGHLLQNAAVEPDGIELDFQGDKCGHSYRIKENSIKTWNSFFWDWRECGWVELRGYGGGHNRHQAIETCNRHAIETKLIKFLPTRPKFKPTHWAVASGGAIGAAANPLAGYSLFGCSNLNRDIQGLVASKAVI